SPGHRDLHRIFANPTESQLAEITQFFLRQPLRFYYAGLAQEDAVAACIYFYRVIEFYSFMTHEAMIRRLRHDGSLTDHEFSRKILDVVTRDEKGPVFRLIAAVADNDLLERAKTEGVVQNALANVLAESVYAFSKFDCPRQVQLRLHPRVDIPPRTRPERLCLEGDVARARENNH
ncbi:hypothetical protein, partial [Sinorhizobium meliloti]|uniref:hypothetical protein n=1 Tax=Rhizobium meliloti TaxID=382 RepID=UPI001AECB3C4